MALCQWLSAIKINSHIRSCVGVCAKSRARYQVVLFLTGGTQRRKIDDPAKHRLVPRLPRQQSRQRECTASKTIPSGSKALLCLSIPVAGALGKPLSPAPRAPSTPSPSSPLLCPFIVACQYRFEPSLNWPTSLRPFAAACMRVSLLLLLLRLATGGTGCALLVDALYSCLMCVQVQVLL